MRDNKRRTTEDRATQPMEAGGWVSQFPIDLFNFSIVSPLKSTIKKANWHNCYFILRHDSVSSLPMACSIFHICNELVIVSTDERPYLWRTATIVCVFQCHSHPISLRGSQLPSFALWHIFTHSHFRWNALLTQIFTQSHLQNMPWEKHREGLNNLTTQFPSHLCTFSHSPPSQTNVDF